MNQYNISLFFKSGITSVRNDPSYEGIGVGTPPRIPLPDSEQTGVGLQIPPDWHVVVGEPVAVNP